jgi:hypothetical protein
MAPKLSTISQEGFGEAAEGSNGASKYARNEAEAGVLGATRPLSLGHKR